MCVCVGGGGGGASHPPGLICQGDGGGAFLMEFFKKILFALISSLRLYDLGNI